jgi:hypothetical protein
METIMCKKESRRALDQAREKAQTRAQMAKDTKYRNKRMQVADCYGRSRNRLDESPSCPDPEEARRQGGQETEWSARAARIKSEQK